MKFLILRIIFPLILFLLVRSLLRGFFAPARTEVSRPRVPEGGELKKDPVCGTYVSTAASLQEKVKGEVVYFCSRECLEKYRKQ